MEVVCVIYSYLVIIDYGFALGEFHDIKRSLKELDKILVQLPRSTAGAVLQESVNNFYENQGRPPRIPENLIRIYGLENAASFWAAAMDEAST